ncbi:hypothetical protein C1645_838191, partial [Glomus cerebriforme]
LDKSSRSQPDALTKEEKESIIKKIRSQLESKQNPNDDKISWKIIIAELRVEFKKDKVHSENKVKNFWHNTKKQILAKKNIPPDASPLEILCEKTLEYNFQD